MLHVTVRKIGSSSLLAALNLAQLRLLELPTGQGLLLKPWTD